MSNNIRKLLFTGGVWSVKVTILEGKDIGQIITIGRIMFEGDGRGMSRLGTFDEMLGCTKCNAIQHKDTRFGPTVVSEDFTIRTPTKILGTTKASKTTCKKYKITGSSVDKSVSFESGPLTQGTFPDESIRGEQIW